MARRSPSPRFTYGLKKASILAALINALLLLVAVGAIAAEAVRRLLNPAPSDAPTMIWVAALAIVVNLVTALLFLRKNGWRSVMTEKLMYVVSIAVANGQLDRDGLAEIPGSNTRRERMKRRRSSILNDAAA